MNAKEKAAYVKGLVSGMKLDESRDETKIFNAIIDWMGSISSSVAHIEQDIEDICEDIEDLSDGLSEVEDIVHGKCDCKCGCDDDCDCGCHKDEDDDDEFYEVTCPSCKEKVYLSEDMICKEEMNCPGCGEHLEFDMHDCCDCKCDCEDEDEDECDSDCRCGCKSRDDD